MSSQPTLWVRVDRLDQSHRYRKLSNPVGRLDLDLYDNSKRKVVFATCTATIVAPEYVLTNYHCIPGLSGNYSLRRASILMDFLDAEYGSEKRYTVQIEPVEADRQLDYSILRVQGNPSQYFGVATITTRSVRANEELFIIHHPAGKTKRVSYNLEHCRTLAYQPVKQHVLRHRCHTLPGSSGALIYSDQDQAILGLHRAGGVLTKSEDEFRHATLFSSILAKSALLSRLAKAPVRTLPTVQEPRLQSRKVDATGETGRYMSSHFNSYEELEEAACGNAQETAKQKLAELCNSGKITNVTPTKACSYSGQRVRTYSWSFSADCVTGG